MTAQGKPPEIWGTLVRHVNARRYCGPDRNEPMEDRFYWPLEIAYMQDIAVAALKVVVAVEKGDLSINAPKSDTSERNARQATERVRDFANLWHTAFATGANMQPVLGEYYKLNDEGLLAAPSVEPQEPSAACGSEFLKEWEATCVHHTDTQRQAAKGKFDGKNCPVCTPAPSVERQPKPEGEAKFPVICFACWRVQSDPAPGRCRHCHSERMQPVIIDATLLGDTKEEWIEKARKELDTGAVEDTKRLDWLEHEKPTALCLCEFDETNGRLSDSIVGHHWEINDQYTAPTLREAIDAAMGKEAATDLEEKSREN